MPSAEALQRLRLNTYQRATKIHVDLLQDRYEVETGKGLSYEEEEEKKDRQVKSYCRSYVNIIFAL